MRTRIGLIGYGYWGPNLARNFADFPGTVLAAISDMREDRLEQAARLHPGAVVSRDWRAVVGDPGIDAVAIATPVGTHYELAFAALEAVSFFCPHHHFWKSFIREIKARRS